MKKIGIIGAGLSGLVSAWYLNKFNPETQITILEGDKKGGQVCSEEYENITLENGPSFLSLENPVLHYALSQSGSTGLIQCRDVKPYILQDTYYQKAPGGFMEFENGRLSYLSGGISSFFGMKKKVSIWDSVSFFDFLKSTYGHTYAETFGSMFARNVFFTEAENLNFRAACPDLYTELKKGANLKDSLANLTKENNKYWQQELSSSFVPGIYYFSGGLGKIAEVLTDDLKRKNVNIEYAKIHDITEQKGEFTLHSKKSKYGPFDKIIVTVSAQEQAVFWKNLHKDFSQKLEELKQRMASSVYTSYNLKDFNRAGLGVFIPRKEKLTISGAVYMNSLNPEIEKRNQFLTRTIITGDLSLFNDQELIDIQETDYDKIFSIKSKPKWSRVFRHAAIGPVLDNEYFPWKKSVVEMLNTMPGISIIGKDMCSADINQTLVMSYEEAKKAAVLGV